MEINFKTNYMEIVINPDCDSGDNYKGYMALSAKNDSDISIFFMECYELRLLKKCKELFPEGGARLEDWTVLMEIKADSDKEKLPNLIRFVKDLENEFLSQIQDSQ